MSSNKIAYGTSTAIAITAGSLGNATARQSASVDNSSNLYLDALVTITVGIGTVAAPKTVNVYVAGSEDGTAWPGEGSGSNDGVTGADAAITLEAPTNLRLLTSISTPTSTKTYIQVGSVAQAFGGVIPRKWSIIVDNESGAALTSCALQYSGVFSTSV